LWASHDRYKDRQKKAVMRRLQLGGQSSMPEPSDSSGQIPTVSDVRKGK
jgi:hypothetical protein